MFEKLRRERCRYIWQLVGKLLLSTIYTFGLFRVHVNRVEAKIDLYKVQLYGF